MDDIGLHLIVFIFYRKFDQHNYQGDDDLKWNSRQNET